MAKRANSPPNPPPMAWCPKCQVEHPAMFTVGVVIFAWMASLSPASVYSYHSRGGILPMPLGRPGGSPKWLTCEVVSWLAGRLPPDKIEPVRSKKGRNE